MFDAIEKPESQSVKWLKRAGWVFIAIAGAGIVTFLVIWLCRLQ